MSSTFGKSIAAFAVIFQIQILPLAFAEDDSGDVPVNGEQGKAYAICLANKRAKIQNDYNCNKHLEQQSDDFVVDKKPYNICIDAMNAESAAAADKCYKNAFASTPSIDPTVQSKTPAQSPTTPAKDQSRVTPSSSQPQAKQTPSATTPKTNKQQPQTSVADAQTQIQTDLDNCTNLQNQASRCCGNPLSCAGSLSRADQQSLAQLMQSGPQNGQSMTDYCNQMRQQSANSGSVNNALAQTCAAPQASCQSSCESMMNKYTNLANQNSNNDLGSIYSNAADQFMSAANTCMALQSRANQLATQGISSGGTQSMSQACQQASLANPTTPTANGNPVPTSPTQAKLDATVNCVANPNAAECKNQNQANKGSSGFDSQEKKGGFDVPDAGTRSTDYFGNNMQTQSAAAKVGTVPNNTGGAFGLSGGSSGAAANARSGRPSPGSPGYTTDILQGTTSGGGYTYGSGSGSGLEDHGFGSNFFARNKRQKNEDGGLLGMDLRQFLPGGSRDPRRALAGINGHSEINAKEEDIWRRISIKMVEKCKLGVLWRCD